ncbi:hypothetical protein ACFQ78_36735 [Streptomyces sp. NPDC056519]|uniref:hypothetical protein n=1 Tax=Streptomyces sp. NPDC056519 TaxID=3345849 RepID=UPI00367AFBD3
MKREGSMYVNRLRGAPAHSPPEWNGPPAAGQDPYANPYAQPDPSTQSDPYPTNPYTSPDPYGRHRPGTPTGPQAEPVPYAPPVPLHAALAPRPPAYGAPGTPLYDGLVLEWRRLDRCTPECCRPGTAPVVHLGEPHRW